MHSIGQIKSETVVWCISIVIFLVRRLNLSYCNLDNESAIPFCLVGMYFAKTLTLCLSP